MSTLPLCMLNMASRLTTSLLSNSTLRSSRIISPSTLHPYPRLPRITQPAFYRLAHSIPKPPSRTSSEAQLPLSKGKHRKFLEPHYELTFTCVPCSGRSSHTISKQGYHKGSVLITCPSCRNRHIISDHLNIFGNRSITVEDLMREKGQLVKRGTLGETGDIEFWEDGTVTQRGAYASDSSADPAAVRNELDALSEEQEATIAREARDPSSQSADSAGTTSTPLGNAGARPSLDSTQHTNHVPSTRRQFSTSMESENQANSNNESLENPEDTHTLDTPHEGPSKQQTLLSSVEKVMLEEMENRPDTRRNINDEANSEANLAPEEAVEARVQSEDDPSSASVSTSPEGSARDADTASNETLPASNVEEKNGGSFRGVRYYTKRENVFRKVWYGGRPGGVMEIPKIRRVPQ